MTRQIIQGSVLETLRGSGVEWMRSMFIDDIVASHSDNVLDIPTLAMTLKSNEAYNTNVAVQVLPFFASESLGFRVEGIRKENCSHDWFENQLGNTGTKNPTTNTNNITALCAGCSGPGCELCEEGRQRHSAR